VIIDDLEDAISAEVCLEQWGGHAGTSAKVLQVNCDPWVAVTEPVLPAKERPESYSTFLTRGWQASQRLESLEYVNAIPR
jgi:hypothetical protein